MLASQNVLMCPPDYFGVNYVINPWMEGHFTDTNRDVAAQQWQHLRREIEKHAKVVIQPAQLGLPDLVFTANAGLVWKNQAIISRFRDVERQGEEPHDRTAFVEAGFDLVEWPHDVSFEGAGDALFDRGQEVLWVGHGFRSHADAPRLLAEKLAVKTVALTLRDPRFYHLDTCLCPLAGGYLLYFPAAFDADSLAAIEAHVPPNKRMAVDEADALGFCCNAVDLNAHIIMNYASESLQKRLRGSGFTPVIVPLSEFMKAGGAAKCLTLKLVEA